MCLVKPYLKAVALNRYNYVAVVFDESQALMKISRVGEDQGYQMWFMTGTYRLGRWNLCVIYVCVTVWLEIRWQTVDWGKEIKKCIFLDSLKWEQVREMKGLMQSYR